MATPMQLLHGMCVCEKAQRQIQEPFRQTSSVTVSSWDVHLDQRFLIIGKRERKAYRTAHRVLVAQQKVPQVGR